MGSTTPTVPPWRPLVQHPRPLADGQFEQKGAKNVSTLWRELEKRMSADIALDGVDPLHVIEWAMRYFLRA